MTTIRRRKIIVLGYGAIGRGFLDLCLSSDLNVDYIVIDQTLPAISTLGPVGFLRVTLTADNLQSVLEQRVGQGDVVVHLTGTVDTFAVLEICRTLGAMYLDTANSFWPSALDDAEAARRTQLEYHKRVRGYAQKRMSRTSPTVLINHGANPGLVSHFTKAAMLAFAQDQGLSVPTPCTREGWGKLAQLLNIQTIQICEHDSQKIETRAQGNFVSTWSPEGLQEEGLLKAEWAWGSNEPQPPTLIHVTEEKIAFIEASGFQIQTRGWTPSWGEINGFLIQHAECQSISDYLTLAYDGRTVYRPTVHYCYRPCPSARDSIEELLRDGGAHAMPSELLLDKLTEGTNELGVLLGASAGGWWFGFTTPLNLARRLGKNLNSTSLQVAAGAYGGLRWMLSHPFAGFNEPENLPHDEILALTLPFLGLAHNRKTDWRPSLKQEGAATWNFEEFLVSHACNGRLSPLK